MSDVTDLVIQKYKNLFPNVKKADEAIALMEQNFLPIKVADHQDKVNFEKAHEARMIVRSKRIEVEKTRKELKADALAYTKAVDGEARRLTDSLEKIENHLYEQEDVVSGHAARLALEKAKAEEQARIQEAKRLQEEAEKQAEERRKLDEERRKLDEERKELEEKKAQAEKERKRIIQEEENKKKLELIRAESEKRRAEEEKQRIEQAARQATIDAENRMKAEQQAKDRAAAQRKAEEERKEAEKKAEEARKESAKKKREQNAPDRTKLLQFAKKIGELIKEIPECREEDGIKVAKKMSDNLQRLSNWLKDEAEKI
jgi:unconventional prefoldin RPB5 interactor 1